MKRPDMVLFDYGHTLLYQPNHNTSNGNKAIYSYISKNPRNITFEEYDKTVTDIFGYEMFDSRLPEAVEKRRYVQRR